MISIALVIPLYSGQYSELAWATRDRTHRGVYIFNFLF